MSDLKSEVAGRIKEDAERGLRTLDDIPREITGRRLHSEFSNSVTPEKSEVLWNRPDHIETLEEFKKSGRKAGLENTDGVVGWSTDLESPAHVLKGDVPREIATLVHEDLHRVTHPETLREMNANPALRELYEGITEYFTERAVTGLHEHKSGQFYPEQAQAAAKLAREVGETNLRQYFFQHELTEEIEKALRHLSR